MASTAQKTDRDYIRDAKAIYQSDGEIEIDDDAKVSRNDDSSSSQGAYVQAWVWVANDCKCDECGVMVPNVVVCADQRELCHSCFAAGAE